MTHSKQAAKRVRQTEQRRDQNRMILSATKTAVKNVRSAPTKQEAMALMPTAVKRLDKAAKTRVIHPNAASRLKSRLARAVAAKS